MCGVTRSLEKLTEEFTGHIRVKKSEIVSLKPEHQTETDFLKLRISVDEIGWHVELGQRNVKSLLDAMAMNLLQIDGHSWIEGTGEQPR